jgi:hypothetical protein
MERKEHEKHDGPQESSDREKASESSPSPDRAQHGTTREDMRQDTYRSDTHRSSDSVAAAVNVGAR